MKYILFLAILIIWVSVITAGRKRQKPDNESPVQSRPRPPIPHRPHRPRQKRETRMDPFFDSESLENKFTYISSQLLPRKNMKTIQEPQTVTATCLVKISAKPNGQKKPQPVQKPVEQEMPVSVMISPSPKKKKLTLQNSKFLQRISLTR